MNSTLCEVLDKFEFKKPSGNFQRWEPEAYQLVLSETVFLKKATTDQRLWHIRHNITELVYCVECTNNPVTWNGSTRAYKKFCSSTCSSRCKTVIDKRQQTMLELYGVKNYTQHDEFNEKRCRTNNHNYGHDWAMQSNMVKQKFKQTMLDRYGGEHTLQSLELSNKVKNTLNDRYGVDHNSATTSWHESVKRTNLTNIGYEHNSQIHISQSTLNILNDKKYLYTQHVLEKLPLWKIAENLHVDSTTIANYCRKHGVSINRYAKSYGERELNKFIQSLGIHTISGDRSIITPRELDIYIPSHALAIEYCGLYWHSEQNGKNKHYHESKYESCKQQNIQLLTIFEDEWVNRQQQIKNKIKSLVGLSNDNSIYARQTNIINMTTGSKRIFMNEHHIQGDGPGSITYGLETGDDVVACMTFTRKNSTGEYYLNRYATSCRVVGGFSKLLKQFERNNKWTQIISFADQRWSNGNLYYKCGFELDKIIPPDYSYSPNGKDRYHKFNYRHKYLERRLQVYDPSLTERENCDRNGIQRIWDCGKMRFVKNNEQ